LRFSCPEAQESHDIIWTSDDDKPSIVVSGRYRKITSRRSQPGLHAVRRIASKKERQIPANLTVISNLWDAVHVEENLSLTGRQIELRPA
jgi:hypothetical protein